MEYDDRTELGVNCAWNSIIAIHITLYEELKFDKFMTRSLPYPVWRLSLSTNHSLRDVISVRNTDMSSQRRMVPVLP